MQVDPCVLVIFGASGDLTRRKLIPAMYEMFLAGLLPEEACVLGTARREKTDDEWREELAPWVREMANEFDEESWRAFAKRVHYHACDATSDESYPDLSARINALSEEHSSKGNILFFLSVAPHLYSPIVECIDRAELVTEVPFVQQAMRHCGGAQVTKKLVKMCGPQH